ncbi:sugar ABC transporter substrate-binding protein [Bacillus sp. FJAT-18017]|uniref:ABC transporter substrate-binding protein n=1 Tax=Bacillus sp. FJAT-18017 TaxID=1705566 RepID=UPI0006ADEADD|nr:sugar ABC transporter substrate-binding protein [Bacillus sp. FJAT-18017]ALC91504.1 sugar ABC transporter substrate-binding protein [Bacillus sp. FJAT-18017]
MRKVLAIFVALFVLVMTACSSSGSDTASGKKGKDGKVEITVGVWDDAQAKSYEPVIEKFEAANPGVKVKMQVTPWDQYWTKLETAATGSVLPDVFWMNGPNFVKYASNGILLPLDDLIKDSKVDLNNFPESMNTLYNYDGKQYGIPKDIATTALFYNKKLFDEAGVKYPDNTWDWNDMIEAAKKLTNVDKDVYGIAAKLNNQSNYYNTIYQAGGKVISDDLKKSHFDDAGTIEGLKFWTDLIHVHKVSPTLETMTDNEPRSLFESEKVAMLWDGSWMAGPFAANETLKGNVDVAELPQGKQRATIVHGLSHAISANTKHKEEAWKFLEYLGSEEANQLFSESGAFTPAYEGTEEAWVKSIPEMNLQVFIDSLEYAVPYPSSKNTPAWQGIEGDYLSKAWTGEQDVATAAKAFAKKMNEVLAEE